jgi:hypothetical protein
MWRNYILFNVEFNVAAVMKFHLKAEQLVEEDLQQATPRGLNIRQTVCFTALNFKAF